MKIIKGRTKIDLNQKEKEMFTEMAAFTRRFFEENNQCNGFSCCKCPLNTFCGSDRDNFRYTVQNAIDSIEDFLNEDK